MEAPPTINECLLSTVEQATHSTDVQQGSVPGPSLFIMYRKVFNFAEDIAIYYSIENVSSLYKYINIELGQL